MIVFTSDFRRSMLVSLAADFPAPLRATATVTSVDRVREPIRLHEKNFEPLVLGRVSFCVRISDKGGVVSPPITNGLYLGG